MRAILAVSIRQIFTALILASPLFAQAADQNGYTAQYECRAGNPNCDVDVAALAARQCQQTITVSTAPTYDWSAINWSNDVICIEAGDYSARGSLWLGSSGTPGNRKILRYVRTNDNDDEPWNQQTQAKIKQIDTNWQSRWLIHRLTVDADNDSLPYGAFVVWDGSSDIIVNRMLIQRAAATLVTIGINTTVDRISIQNSVIRTAQPAGNNPQEHQCISVVNASSTWIVNNEVYDCNKAVSMGDGTYGRRIVVENNDLYISAAGRTNCSGTYDPNGNCSVTESIISWKNGGDETNPNTILHNRLWGMRWADGALTQGGDCPAISISADGGGGSADWVLVHNNIIFDGDLSVWNYHGTGTAPNNPNNVSVVGNLVFQIRDHTPEQPGELPGGLMYRDIDASEYYLNTVIGTEYWFVTQGYGQENDMRCNVAISSGPQTGDIGAGVQFDRDVFYDTPAISEPTAISNAVVTRANGSSYAIGQILRTSPYTACTTASSPACFLYRVIVAGTTSGSAPTYCTTLGCTITDGSATLQAVRGPYSFYRKLRTAPELYAIPYAAVHTSADESNFCPSSFANRGGIGINDDTAWTGIFAQDMKGATRNGTPGAVQATGGDGGGGGGGNNQTPYGGTPWPIPGVIEAEHFDDGGDGIAYHDTTAANEGAAYRTTAVDLEPSAENGYNIGWTQPGEWLEYSISVATTGTYAIDVRVASAGQGGVLRVEVDGVDVTGPLTVPNTGGWQIWQTLTTTGVSLTAGAHVLRLAFDSAGATGDIGNVNYLQLALESDGGTGTIFREYWTGIPGDFVTDLTSHPNYPNGPSGSDQLNVLEAPVDWADNYGTRVRGYVHAPQSGNYIFWIAGDDYSELWLSADDNPANKILIASVNGWTSSREWTKYASQQSTPITLQAGQRYYIEVLHKEGVGGDNVAVGWQLPGGTLERPIPGNRLSPWIPSGGAQSPYGGTSWPIPGLVEIEHFDEGGEGIAYHDASNGNGGAVAFRAADHVDLYQSIENGYNVGWTQPGEWIEYTINVTATDTYVLDLRVASNGQGGDLHVEIDGVDVTGRITVPNTGGWDTWQTISRGGISLTAGVHVLRVSFDTVGPTTDTGNINYFALRPDSGTNPTGTIRRQYWLGIPGEAMSDLTSNTNYPNNPSGTDQLTTFEAPTDAADNYGTRIQGYAHAPQSGSYTFWIASDDDAELWLSTDANPANKVRIAYVNGWTASREWNKYPSQQSVPINLTAGQRYYIEALHKEGNGGDNLAVGWQLPDGTFEGPIPGNRLSPVSP